MATNKTGRSIIRPVIVRGEEKFIPKDVIGHTADITNDGIRIPRADAALADKFKPATEKIDTAYEEFSVALNRFIALEQRHIDFAKRASGNVRDAAEKLAQGLARIEKLANFTRLEQYVTLLERAATAMNSLAELEASGKLDKITGALR